MDDELLIVDRTDYIPTGRVEDADLAGDCSSADLSQPVLTDMPAASAPRADDGQEVFPERVLEALLFAADSPLSAGRLAELIGGCTPARVRQSVARLNDKYVDAGLTFRIESIARGYQMMTLPCYQPWLAKLNTQRAQTRLSAAALEALAIVAYKQPVIRVEVEAIRGVGCGEVLNRLREMGLVKIVGRAEVVGRPLLYGTTRKFLDVFGLADLDDLPPMEALATRHGAAPPEEVADAPAAEQPVAASA